MKGTHLGELEELILLSVGILYKDAYGLAIADNLEKQTGRSLMISSVHKVLVRLEKKGYVRSAMGGSTSERGGRKKRLYMLTPGGVKALDLSMEVRNAMYNQVDRVVLHGGKI